MQDKKHKKDFRNKKENLAIILLTALVVVSALLSTGLWSSLFSIDKLTGKATACLGKGADCSSLGSIWCCSNKCGKQINGSFLCIDDASELGARACLLGEWGTKKWYVYGGYKDNNSQCCYGVLKDIKESCCIDKGNRCYPQKDACCSHNCGVYGNKSLLCINSMADIEEGACFWDSASNGNWYVHEGFTDNESVCCNGQIINGISCCNENWQCSNWGECINDTETRICSDANNCNTDLNKPSEIKQCNATVCSENWQCSDWNECINKTQARRCDDLNECNTTIKKPDEIKECGICNENWICSEFGICINGAKTRECADLNQCNTTIKKPDEKQNCSECVLQNVYWSKTEAVDNEYILLVANNSDCEGKNIKYDIYEDDGGFGKTLTKTLSADVDKIYTSVSWTALWQDDNPLPFMVDDPEYIFTATLDGMEKTSNMLYVTYSGTAAINATVEQFQAIINQPVAWKQVVEVKGTGEVTIDIPEVAFDVSVEKVVEDKKTEVSDENVKIKKNNNEMELSEFEAENKKEALAPPQNELFGIKTAEIENASITIDDTAQRYEIGYKTEAPVAVETNISENKKEIVISSDVHYENILAYTNIVPEANPDAVKLYWLVNGTKQLVDTIKYDKNNNSLIDYIEWTVPSLSNQTYELELTILNVQSYPTVGGNWVVAFTTSGVANLTITAVNDTAYGTSAPDDLEFLNLKCNDTILNTTFNGSSVFYEDYNCNDTGYHSVKVLTPGTHTQEFKFGDLTAYANNWAVDYRIIVNQTNSYNWSNGVFSQTRNDGENITLNYNFGDGSDGNLVVSSANTIINNYTQVLNTTLNAGDISIKVSDSSNFTAGDEILIIQMQNSSGGAGQYEFKDVALSSGNVITLTSGLQYSYKSGTFDSTSATATQIVRVPQYINLTVNSGASITAPAWDGYKGGIVVFRATGVVNVSSGGAINVTGKGFRGGIGAPSEGDYIGRQGESYKGLGSASTSANFGGGGGGSSNGQWGATGGGGGGGYSSTGASGIAKGIAVSCSGHDPSMGTGGTGGETYGESGLSKLYFGSGGGGGGWGLGEVGGKGGGIVIIFSSSMNLSNVTAAGQNGIDIANEESGGGGGSGGTIYLVSSSINILNISAIYGFGSINTYGICNTGANGGNGGNGRIRLDYLTLNGAGGVSPSQGYNGTPSSYYISGNYTSQILDGNSSVTWKNISYGNITNGGNITFYTQSCDDNSCSGESWNGPYTNTNPATLSETPNRYFRYKIILSTANTSRTPYVQWANISYTENEPNIALDRPYQNALTNKNGSSGNELNFTFVFSDADNENGNCTLFFNLSSSEPTNASGNISNIPSGSTATITINRSLSDGTYKWLVNCTDGVLINNSATWTVTINTAVPAWNINSIRQSNVSIFSARLTNLTLNDNCNVVNGSASKYISNCSINMTNSSGNTLWYNRTIGGVGNSSLVFSHLVDLSSLTDGNYTLNYIANDNITNSRNEIYKFEMDNTIPSVDYGSGTLDNNSLRSQNWIYVNLSVTENNFNNVTFYLFNSSLSLIREINSSSNYYYNFTSLGTDNTYYYNLTLRDRAGNQNRTGLRKIILDMVSPTISLISPSNNAGTGDGTLTLVYNVSDTSNVVNCSLVVNNILNQTLSSVTKDSLLTFNLNISSGNYNWSINCTDNATNIGQTGARRMYSILFRNFTGTNLSLVDISSIENFYIEKNNYGKINFTQAVDITGVLDIDNYVNISYNRIEVNSTNLTALNKSAIIFLYNLTFSNPRILRDGSVCSSDICVKLSYTGGNLTFNVTSFSYYSAEETPVTAEAAASSSGGSAGGGCLYKWNCTEWNECNALGIQTRICTNKGNCPNTYKKPATEQACSYITPPEIPQEEATVPEETPEEKPVLLPETEKPAPNRIKWIPYIVLIMITAFIITTVYAEKTRKNTRKEQKNLEEYLKKIRMLGCPKQNAKKILLNEGWPEEMVDEAIAFVYDIKQILMLKEKIKEHIEKGFTKKQIKDELVKKGWNNRIVERIIKEI